MDLRHKGRRIQRTLWAALSAAFLLAGCAGGGKEAETPDGNGAEINIINDSQPEKESFAGLSGDGASGQEPGLPGIPEMGQEEAILIESIPEEDTEPDPDPAAFSKWQVLWRRCVVRGEDLYISCFVDPAFSTRIPDSIDGKLYLVELEPYMNEMNEGTGVSMVRPENRVCFSLPLHLGTRSNRLYNRFQACILTDVGYKAVSEPVYVTNPEAVAVIQSTYTEPYSKKGLLIELTEYHDAFNLGVCSVIVNIPFDTLFGEGIDFELDGRQYSFDRGVVEAYDRTISTFSNKSMNVVVILLNRWDPETPDLIYPGTQRRDGVNYYHFNTATKEGCQNLKAAAAFLASRYNGTSPACGKVQNWIVGNEVNNQLWNYIGPMELTAYAAEFERTFRIFYSAIRSECSSDRIYFSTDYNWMCEADGSLKYNARDFIETFAALVKTHGDIEWNLAYHPYSVPMNEPEFWDDRETGKVSFEPDSPIVNFANLSVLTDFMQEEGRRAPDGSVRHIILSEEGFTSQSPTRGNVERLQAASFAYAYYLADSNPFIDMFILSRQIDAPSEKKQSMAFGLWTTDSTEDVSIKPKNKKFIWDVFKHIDKEKTTLEYTAFAKEILGIERWSDIIPGFVWRKLE